MTDLRKMPVYTKIRPAVHFKQSFRTSSTNAARESPHVGFYKSFGRPIAKVFLGALCTYQVLYLVWHKLETEENMAQQTHHLQNLEHQLYTLIKKDPQSSRSIER